MRESFIAHMALRLVSAATWEQCKRIVHEQSDVLLSDDAIRFMTAATEAKNTRSNNDNSMYPQHLEFLKTCRAIGVEEAFKIFKDTPRLTAVLGEDGAEDYAELVTAKRSLLEVFEITNIDEKWKAVAELAPFLFTKRGDQLLAQYYENAVLNHDEESRSFLQIHIMLLIRLRRIMQHKGEYDGRGSNQNSH